MAKYVIPPINESIMKPNGTMSLAWYLYLTQGGSGGGLPDQTGHAGEFLTTDGTDASWSDTAGYHPDLFDHKWADHILNDVQWLRADTFSWQSGAVYQAAYAHLADDIDGKILQSETVGGTTIQFYLADDGHKICPDTEESNVATIYTATGVAWYYIIDTTNQRFKLPRTRFGFTGIRTGVGNYVDPALPNVSGGLTNVSSSRLGGITATGAFAATYKGQTSASGDDVKENVYDISFSAHDSSNVYKDGATVQQSATEQYLYFYVGNFTQTALENTAGITTEEMNNKVNIGHEVIEFQEPTAANNYTWYRKYRDGWVEQGQSRVAVADQTVQITFPVEMADTYYVWSIGRHIYDVSPQNTNENFMAVKNRTTTGFSVADQWGHTYAWCWQVSGKAA